MGGHVVKRYPHDELALHLCLLGFKDQDDGKLLQHVKHLECGVVGAVTLWHQYSFNGNGG